MLVDESSRRKHDNPTNVERRENFVKDQTGKENLSRIEKNLNDIFIMYKSHFLIVSVQYHISQCSLGKGLSMKDLL